MIVLGVYAGVIAAMAIVPVSIPLLYRLVLAENRTAHADLYVLTSRGGHALEAGREPDFGQASIVRVERFETGVLYEFGTAPSAELQTAICATPDGVLPLKIDGIIRTAICVETMHMRVLAIYPTPTRSYFGVGMFAAALAAIAGLVTALGVLRILRPLSHMGRMLDRLGMGEHGLRMRRTGILEIDRLGEQIDSLAIAVEQRENDILSRLQVAQEIARLVAHEVRNPLQSMEFLTSLLAEEDDPRERHILTKSIHEEIRTLDNVVTRLLREGATRGSVRLHLQSEDIDQLIAHILRLKQRELLVRGTTMEVLPGHVGTLPIDRPLLSRSIENLVTNALRAVPSEGGLIRLSTNVQGTFLQIVVEDNGPGIDPSLGNAIFEANVSGGGGNGLGLSLTKGVIEAHGGKVYFERSELGGARFVLSLPRTPQGSSKVGPRSDIPFEQGGSSEDLGR